MDQQLRRVGESWSDLSPIRKGLLSAVALGIVALGALLYSWSSSPNLVTLYSELDSADSGRIVEQLRARGVAYEIAGGGSTVRVPEAQLDELRVDFASQGLPEGGHVGFEIFEGNAFTATDFVQRLNFQRGLQGEIARTIETFPAVQRARVHIVLPERTLFRDDERPTTASVVLQLHPGRGLAAAEVNAIAHLIAGSVEGLAKSGITVIDAAGAMLFDGSAQDDGQGIGFTSNQIELQRQYERAIERDVQALLDTALGPARALVSVRATLDFDRSEVETESYLPGQEGGVPRSESTVRENYVTSGNVDGGAIPGAVTNVPGANADLPGGDATTGASAGESTSTTYERTETTSNYEVGRQVTRSVEAVGEVQRLSVSLLLDDARVTETQAQALEASVAAAVGLDVARGDQLVTSRIPFDNSALDSALASFEAEQASETVITYARIALPAVLLLLGFILFRMLVRSVDRRAYRTYTVDHRELAPAYPAALDSGVAQQQAVLKTAAAIGQLPTIEESRSDLEMQVEKMARTHPESVAEVVQSWLRED